MKRRLLLLTLLLFTLISSEVWAMGSASYRLDWFTPLTSAGGGPASSPSYYANLTVGQSGGGHVASASYQASLGYWIWTVESGYLIYLPLTTH